MRIEKFDNNSYNTAKFKTLLTQQNSMKNVNIFFSRIIPANVEQGTLYHPFKITVTVIKSLGLKELMTSWYDDDDKKYDYII